MPVPNLRLPSVAIVAAIAACHSARSITIVGVDYAFQAPTTLPPGPTTIVFENKGRVAHELSMARLTAGVSIDSALAAIRSGADAGNIIDGVVGILIAGPGQSSLGQIQVNLAAGRTYVVVCQFHDAQDKPAHVALGMFTGIRVQ